MNCKIVDGKQYILGQARISHSEFHVVDGVMHGTYTTKEVTIIEVFDGEKFVSLYSQEFIEVYNKMIHDIYQRLDALESNAKRKP